MVHVVKEELLYLSKILSVLQYVMEVIDLNPWLFHVPSDLSRMVRGSNHDFSSSCSAFLSIGKDSHGPSC